MPKGLPATEPVSIVVAEGIVLKTTNVNHQPPHEKASSSTRHLQQKGKTDRISPSSLAL